MHGVVWCTGGRLRKLFYASLAMGGAAAVCYPREAADISRRGWTAVRELGVAAYRDNISPGLSFCSSQRYLRILERTPATFNFNFLLLCIYVFFPDLTPECCFIQN